MPLSTMTAPAAAVRDTDRYLPILPPTALFIRGFAIFLMARGQMEAA
jgi:hypothetical protein